MNTFESRWAASLAPTSVLDDLGRSQRHRRTISLLGVLGAGAMVTAVLGVSLGPVPISPVTVWQVIGQHLIGWPHDIGADSQTDSIVWLVRFPEWSWV